MTIRPQLLIIAIALLIALSVIAMTQPPRPQTAPVVVVRNVTATPAATPATPAISPPCQGVKIEMPKLTVCGVLQYDGSVVWSKEGWVRGSYAIAGDASTCVFDTSPGVYVKFQCQTPIGIIVK